MQQNYIYFNLLNCHENTVKTGPIYLMQNIYLFSRLNLETDELK